MSVCCLSAIVCGVGHLGRGLDGGHTCYVKPKVDVMEHFGYVLYTIYCVESYFLLS